MKDRLGAKPKERPSSAKKRKISRMAVEKQLKEINIDSMDEVVDIQSDHYMDVEETVDFKSLDDTLKKPVGEFDSNLIDKYFLIQNH